MWRLHYNISEVTSGGMDSRDTNYFRRNVGQKFMKFTTLSTTIGEYQYKISQAN
jgi:hypothetical protein